MKVFWFQLVGKFLNTLDTSFVRLNEKEPRLIRNQISEIVGGVRESGLSVLTTFLSVYRWRDRNLSVYRWREYIAVSVIKLFLFGLSVKESKTSGFSVIAKYVGFWEFIILVHE